MCERGGRRTARHSRICLKASCLTVSGFAQGEVMAAGPWGRGSSGGEGTMVGNGASPAASGGADSQRPVLQLLSKLRRHASLEGASPYFKIKKWKLDSSQRASSLDTRGNALIPNCLLVKNGQTCGGHAGDLQ